MSEQMMHHNMNAKRAGSTSAVWGHVIVLLAASSFVFSMYTMFGSKMSFLAVLEEDTNNGNKDQDHSILKFIQEDVYYCYLIPLTIPISILMFYANWVSLKFFRHN